MILVLADTTLPNAAAEMVASVACLEGVQIQAEWDAPESLTLAFFCRLYELAHPVEIDAMLTVNDPEIARLQSIARATVHNPIHIQQLLRMT